MENLPECEKNEMVDVYMDKGIPKEDAERIVELLFTSSQAAFLDVMVIEELGIGKQQPILFRLFMFVSLLSLSSLFLFICVVVLRQLSSLSFSPPLSPSPPFFCFSFCFSSPPPSPSSPFSNVCVLCAGIMPKEVGGSAWKGALTTFVSFLVLGGLPMTPYLFSGRV